MRLWAKSYKDLAHKQVLDKPGHKGIFSMFKYHFQLIMIDSWTNPRNKILYVNDRLDKNKIYKYLNIHVFLTAHKVFSDPVIGINFQNDLYVYWNAKERLTNNFYSRLWISLIKVELNQ